MVNETNSYRGMFDVSKKVDTLRSATAQAIVRVNPESIDLIKNERTPKGDIIQAAKISATLGAKKNMGIDTILSSHSDRSYLYTTAVTPISYRN